MNTVYENILADRKREGRKGPQKETPGEGKVFLRVPHYRLVEIDEAEINNLVSVIKSSRADTCEETIINAFFKLAKTRTLHSRSNLLNDREVAELWESFKEVSTCLLRTGGM